MTETHRASRVEVSIIAGPIKVTGNKSPLVGHQLALEGAALLYVTPDIAAQWIQVLETVAKEAE